MCKFEDYSATHVLREIKLTNFGVSKTAILTVWEAEILAILGITFKEKKKNCLKNKNSVAAKWSKLQFSAPEIAYLDFT